MAELPASSPPPREAGRRIHRRETWLQLWLPFGLGLLFVFGLVGLAALMNDPQAMLRVSTIADFMITLFVLCPVMICLIPVYALVVIMIYGMNRLHRGVGTPLERLEHATEQLAQRTHGWTGNINQWVAKTSIRFAFIGHFLSVFEPPQEKGAPHAKSNNDSR